jgi:hypothetical protein
LRIFEQVLSYQWPITQFLDDCIFQWKEISLWFHTCHNNQHANHRRSAHWHVLYVHGMCTRSSQPIAMSDPANM